jgi:hypothetical protein
MSVPAGFTDAIPLTQPFGDPTYSDTPIAYAGNQTVAALPENVVDWVLVELRSGIEAVSAVAQRPAFVLANGDLADLNGGPVGFLGIDSTSYYVVIRHRNHADVMSASPVDFSSGTGSWDFTTGMAQAFSPSIAAPMKDLGDGHFGLFAGDANLDSFITAPDFNIWNAGTSGGAAGYEAGDSNLDSFVTAPDFNLWNANTTAGAASQVPD